MLCSAAVHVPLHVRSSTPFTSSVPFTKMKCTGDPIHSHPGVSCEDESGGQYYEEKKLHTSSLEKAQPKITFDIEGSSSTVWIQQDEESLARRETCAVAEGHYDEIFQDPSITIPDKSDHFPKFLRYQVLGGKILGKGASCDVSEVRGFQHLNGPPPFGNNKVQSSAFTTTSEPFRSAPNPSQSPISFGNFLPDNMAGAAMSLSKSKWIPPVTSCVSCSTNGNTNGVQSTPTASRWTGHEDDDEVLKESRDFIADNCYQNGSDARYAIKSLSHTTMENPEKLLQGIFDMATEARILSNITRHPNVIKMRAVSQGGPFGGSSGFFIILDRLYDTLEKRLGIWKQQCKRLQSMGAKLLRRDRFGCERKKLYEDRLVAAYDLSSALAYIHKNRIIHRDLKPANIGFDIRGDIKIFDFGMAKVLPRTGADENGRFAFTAMSGTMRYMAPEVGLGQSYNESCDTFSFAILLWEIMTLQRPYGNIGVKELEDEVWENRRRPPIQSTRPKDSASNRFRRLTLWRRTNQDCSISTPLQILMKRGWSSNPKERPKMVHVERILRKECICFRNGDESGLEHSQRRSTHVFHRSKTARTL